MPYPEFRRWQLYFELEPWGFVESEYQTAALLTMLHNVNSTRKQQKGIQHFVRDMLKGILDSVKEPTAPTELSREELIKLIKKDLGIR